jgi:hypothetical protein
LYCRQVDIINLKKAIFNSFENDSKIFDFYDPTSTSTTISEIVEDIITKIIDWQNGQNKLICYEVLIENKIVGFFVENSEYLISFGLNIEFRKRQYLREFFKLIKKQIKTPFKSILWSKNVRAIKWLQKMGMKIENNNIFMEHFITELKN